MALAARCLGFVRGPSLACLGAFSIPGFICEGAGVGVLAPGHSGRKWGWVKSGAATVW